MSTIDAISRVLQILRGGRRRGGHNGDDNEELDEEKPDRPSGTSDAFAKVLHNIYLSFIRN
jgi:hypothetical protein